MHRPIYIQGIATVNVLLQPASPTVNDAANGISPRRPSRNLKRAQAGQVDIRGNPNAPKSKLRFPSYGKYPIGRGVSIENSHAAVNHARELAPDVQGGGEGLFALALRPRYYGSPTLPHTERWLR